MREIKFRGKRLVNNEWIYGGIWFPNTTTRESVCFINDNGNNYAVDASTVGQYTGLEDYEGEEIYDGDILKKTYLNPLTKKETEHFYKIESEKSCYWARALDGWGDTLAYFIDDRYKVIGNIHENPELLETSSATRD